MADKIKKALAKLSAKERAALEPILTAIMANQLQSLDVKQLKGNSSIYRVRKGTLRIIFSSENNQIKVLAISRRSEKTYKDY